MTRFELAQDIPAELTSLPSLYLLGVGGPETAEGVGDVSSFVWRFGLLATAEGEELALAFRAMPRLMAFTRALNGRRPFSVPTEALRIGGNELSPTPISLLLDPSPEDFDAHVAAGARMTERRLPTLGG